MFGLVLQRVMQNNADKDTEKPEDAETEDTNKDDEKAGRRQQPMMDQKKAEQ